jgi:hypothetical protein
MISNEVILAIIGIIMTVVFGIWAVQLVLRYPGKVTFIMEQRLGLYESILANFPELEITYETKPVSRQIVLLKGAFLNSGSKDIVPDMVEQPISMTLPDGYRWLKAKVVHTSPSISAKVNVCNSKLEFEFSLFRCREFIRFEALAEAPGEDVVGDSLDVAAKLEEALFFTHRISDTSREQINIQTYINYKSRLLRSAVGWILCVGPFFLWFNLSEFLFPNHWRIWYMIVVAIFLSIATTFLFLYLFARRKEKFKKLLGVSKTFLAKNS